VKGQAATGQPADLGGSSTQLRASLFHGFSDHSRLVPGVAEVLAAADRVLAVAGETVGACPRYGAGTPAKARA
jgi:hypothetical protein